MHLGARAAQVAWYRNRDASVHAVDPLEDINVPSRTNPDVVVANQAPPRCHDPDKLLERWAFRAIEVVGHDNIAPADTANFRVREWLDQALDPAGSRYRIVVCERNQWSSTGREPTGHRGHLAALFNRHDVWIER